MSNLRAGYTKRTNGMLQKQFSVDGKRYTVYGKTYKECEAKEKQKRKDLFTFDPTNRITLNEYYDIWSKRRDGVVKPSTWRWERALYNNHIGPALGDYKIGLISRNHIYKFQMDLQKDGLHTTSVNSIIRTFRSILKCAIYDGIIYRNPCDGVKQLRRTTPEARDTIHRALTDNELNVFFNNSKHLMYYNLLRFMLLTGVRAGEACALQWGDIDFNELNIYISKTVGSSENGKIIQTPKTIKSRRIIPMNKNILSLLKEQEKYRESVYDVFDNKNFVFPDRHGSYPSPSRVNQTIKNCLNKCLENNEEIDDFASHAFRDTFATKAIEAGMKPETLQYILGHADIKMTMNLYYHLSDDKKKTEMNNINFAF